MLGARVWRLHRAHCFACSPFMAGFMKLKHSELKTAGSVVAEKVVKLTQNVIFGRCCMNPDKFRTRLGVPGLGGDAQDGPQQGLHERAHPSRRPHAADLQALMEKAYYLHMRRLFSKMRLLFTDDSVMVPRGLRRRPRW